MIDWTALGVFVGMHPIFTFLVFLVVWGSLFKLAAAPINLVCRMVRHLNIRASGWPPAHFDAAGDWKKSDGADSES